MKWAMTIETWYKQFRAERTLRKPAQPCSSLVVRVQSDICARPIVPSAPVVYSRGRCALIPLRFSFAPAMTLFEGRDLTCVRGERQVFAGLGFTVPQGGALILHGPNGSGKSSLLRLMAGLLNPAEGSLVWDARPVSDDPEAHRARLHYLGHLDAVKPVLSAAENLDFWASAQGGDPGDGQMGGQMGGQGAGVAAALERIGLTGLCDVPARMLSAGQRRRLALARLFLARRGLWLLDEPTVGLDEDSIGRLQAGLADHRREGGRVVVATHTAIDLPGAERLDLTAFQPPSDAGLEPW
jgi:heme exporter protein A